MSPQPVPEAAEGGFARLGLAPHVMKALDAIGYEAPTSIQEQIIPHVLAGRDVIGQAQTGTGKTAAFALPLLSKLRITDAYPQVLVLVPTRELAIQVSEAFQKYAAQIPGFHVLPVYGGQGYGGQLRQLQRGTHVIVGTPGRLCDHLRRGTLQLGRLSTLVIDEADEMLRMGFIDEVEWIMEQTPSGRQVALFSATMPEPIRRIAAKHLKNAEEITIKTKTTTAATIRQRYWVVSGLHKLDALTRILEGEPFEAMIVFVRTKTAAVDLSARLEARGFACAPLNGDIPQNERERTIEALRRGDLDILVATDVAARGLDVTRVSHVLNYDIPNDTESYIHRIGRTGRAGRTGEAILFVAPRERRLLLSIEKATRQRMDAMRLPTREVINDIRIARFKQRITDTLAVEELGLYYQLVESYSSDNNISPLEVAAALARIAQGDAPLVIGAEHESKPGDDLPSERPAAGGPKAEGKGGKRARADSGEEIPMERFRVEVGSAHGVQPGMLVGAIANEAGIEGRHIGRIKIHEEYCLIDLPEGMPKELLGVLKMTRVCGRPLKMSRHKGETKPERRDVEAKPFKGKKHGKK